MRVDIHAHYFPTGYLERLARYGHPLADGMNTMGAGDAPGEVEARLDLMDTAGVDVQALSVSSLVPFFDDRDAAVDSARLVNDLYVEAAGRWPARFAVLGALPLPHVDAALEELDRVLALPGAVGVAVATSVLGRSIADSAFEPLYAELDRRGALLFIHPAGRAADSPLVAQNGLAWPIGAPIEDTISITHLIARGIPARYPSIRIVNAHLGGAVAMLLQRLDNQYPRAFPEAPELPSEAARRMWYDTVGHAHAPALAAAAASFGADRLVLGTDFPYARGDHYRHAIEYIAAAGLDPAAATAILEGNATALLGLG